VFSMFLGFFAWNKSLAMGGIARISQLQLLQPFVGLAAAWVLLGEQIGWLEIVFALLVVALVALGWRMRVTSRT
jgi:drug/metabolite transporter (DMT)-like permease